MKRIEVELLSAFMYNLENLQVAIESDVEADWFEEGNHKRLFNSLVELSVKKSWNPRTSVQVMQSGLIFKNHNCALEYCETTPIWASKIEDFKSALDVLRKDFVSRVVISSSSKAIREIANGKDPFEISSIIVDEISTLSERTEKEVKSQREYIEEAFEIDSKIAKGESFGLPFPWTNFHRTTFGIPYKSVTPIAGRDGKGKSRLITFLSQWWAVQSFSVLYFAFEDTTPRFYSNSAASLGGYDMFEIRGHLPPSDKFMKTHRESLNKIATLPLYSEDFSLTVERLVTKIASYKRRHKIDVVVIDGFKDLIGSKGENQTQRENHIMQSLTRAAKEYNVSIIPIMHLAKVEDGRWISKQSIKGSGTQTQSARMVLVFQDSGFSPELRDKYNLIEGESCILECQKASYGKIGVVPLKIDLEMGRFTEIISEEDEQRFY